VSAPSTSLGDLDAALAALRQGELVAMPTETVYGLAADARNPDAVRKIFKLKGRPADHPLIVHLAEAGQMEAWAEVGEAARRLAAAFWPGPLTLVLPKRESVDPVVTGGQSTVGLRVPAHPVAHELLARFGPLAAPSANRFGRISPTRADHVREEFPTGIAVVLDGGDSAVGLESTIVDLSATEPRLLRPGHIGRAQIEAVVGPLQLPLADDDGPRASGRLASHYAPRTPAALVDRSELQSGAGPGTVVLALGSVPPSARGRALPVDAVVYAQALYACLRELDACRADRILIERPPQTAAWAAVNDRLRRAVHV
jgi:L-threonylcarbamoyladenylate synthase